MERAKRASMASTSSSTAADTLVSSSSLHLIDTPDRRSIRIMPNDTLRESVSSMSDAQKAKRHSRNMSKVGAGHRRGHSRTGSISLSHPKLGQAPVNEGHPAGDIQQSNRPSSQRSSIYIANTSHSHTRGHSRSGSRSIGVRSRPISLVAPRPQEHSGWNDVDDSSSIMAEMSMEKDLSAENSTKVLPPLETSTIDIMKTPTMDEYQSMSNEATPVAPLPSDINRPAIIPSSSVAQSLSTPAPSSSQEKRRSRHSRNFSVSTRKESMEIMGGLSSLGLIPSAEVAPPTRHSRRISSQRWSGLQSASVLFGGSPDLVTGSKRNSVDWRANLHDIQDNDGTDRLTALEKLEGRTSKRHSRQQSSVQLPSFDDVHGDKGMDKRASMDLMEANEQSTSSSSHTELNIPPVANRALLSPSSSASSLTTPQGNDLNSSVDSNGNEGLGTLMEEEEEEEDSATNSPAKEKTGFNLIPEEERRRRKEAELEVVKRTRRASLTPKPLKLKSRPASLFAAPRPGTALPSSSSLPIITSTDSSDSDSAGAFSTDSEQASNGRASSMSMASSQSPWSITNTQRKLTEARLTGALPDTPRSVLATTPDEKKKIWRQSMPVTPNEVPSSIHGTSQPSAKQGMRALRLTGNMEIPGSSHKGSTESMGSVASTASQMSSGHGSASGKRSSLIYINRDNQILPGVQTANRRSSIQYRSSPLDSSADSSPVHTSHSSSNVQSVTPQSFGGVPMHLFEELKAKHQRDVTLLDESRKNVARLEAELRTESDRLSLEYSELERWSAEEKRGLGQRIEHLEASLVEVAQVRQAREEHFKEEIENLQTREKERSEQFEDVVAERDMLRDDVEGWRTRCGDLEKNLRSERQTNEELRRSKTASSLRVKELTKLLEAHGIEVTPSHTESPLDDGPSGGLPSDLIYALRSPALDAHNGFFSNSDGHTSPSRSRSSSPPPQAIKLLKDMRQHIFNLAGSLEHERKQHIQARQEADALKAENTRMSERSEVDETMATTVTEHTLFSPCKLPTSDSEASSIAPPRQAQMTSSPPARTAQTPSPKYSGNSGKKKRNHVFAYDSSMESGLGSISVGSVSTSTNGTSEYHGGDGQDDRLPLGGVPQGSLGKEDYSTNDTAQQDDLVGLGMGSLDTLAEEEEATTEYTDSGKQKSPDIDEVYSENVHYSVDVDDSQSRSINNEGQDHEEASHESASLEQGQDDLSRMSCDLEAGRPSDIESVAPSTPALEHHSSPLSKDLGREEPHEAATSISAASSQESHGFPLSPLPVDSHASQETLIMPGINASDAAEIYNEEEPLPPRARQEFIREWSFERASAAVQAKKTKPKLRVGTANLFSQQSMMAKTRNLSIDDFFGIMGLDDDKTLPPLPTPDEALDMPPLCIDGEQRSEYGFDWGAPVLSIRPPIAKSSRLYGQSISDRTSMSSTGSVRISRSSPPHQSMQATQETNANPGSGMFGRMMSLTSAFSGLGGYLYGGQATAAPTDIEAHEPQGSVNWTITRREEA